MEISKIKPFVVSKVTDLIPGEILRLLLRGLGELGATLVVEEKDEDGTINRVPLPKEAIKKYWTPICEYLDHFPSGRHECVTDTKKRAEKIIEGNITEPKVLRCHLGLSVVAIPFVFKGEIIGVTFGGKKKLRKSNLYERLEGFKSSILNEEAIWNGEAGDDRWKGKKFDLSEAKSLIDRIPETSWEEFQKEIEELKKAADYIIKVGQDNYYAQSRLRNQQFLFDIMEYFASVYSAGKTPIREILQSIVREITLFARARCGAFIWKRESTVTHFYEEAGIVQCPSPESNIVEIEDFIKTNFKKENGIYCLLIKDLGSVEITEKIKSFLGITPNCSIYAKSIFLSDQSEGFFIFVDPPGRERDFDNDCAEFLSLVTERIKSQIDIYLTDEDRSEFMTEMTHRLKSPMQYIMDESGNLGEYLKEKYPDESEAQSGIQGIIDGVAHLDHQIKNYYYITTMGKGGWSYYFQPHPIAALVRKCARRFRPSANHRGIKILSRYQKDVIEKRTGFDWDTMDIAVSNLLDNAVKYSHFGRDIFVEVSFDDAEEIYTISVADRGLGIDPDEDENIFKKYYRGKNMKDPVRWIPGTGIGLSVVDEIVKAHQGRRNLTSELLKGKEKGDVYYTIFNIFLPYQQKGEKDEEDSTY